MKRLLLWLFSALILIAAILLINTFSKGSLQKEVPQAELAKVNEDAFERLSQAIRIPTISFERAEDFQAAPFDSLHRWISANYPLTDSLLQREEFGLSLLYTWRGSDPDLAPAILIAHQDVVPADEESLDKWTEAPFSGLRKDGLIWGRGAMDDKSSVLGILEAVEGLLQEGFQTRRTIYLAFGHDEEIGGEAGARLIAEALEARGVQACMTLDEGGYVVSGGLVPGLTQPLAIVNLAEKGSLNLNLTVNHEGGHSSNVPDDHAIGVLSRAIIKLDEHPFPLRKIEPAKAFIRTVGPELDFGYRMAFANTWATKGIVLDAIGARTTMVPTILEGGVKINALPTKAQASVNIRLLPGDEPEAALERVIRTIHDERVVISVIDSSGPPPVSSHETEEFRMLERSIRQTMPDALVSPGFTFGGTDSRHFHRISAQVYRFLPIRINPDNVSGFHGIDEFITEANYAEHIQFYDRVLRNLSEGQ